MLLEKLVADPQRHGNISAASIFRLIEHGAPILLLDEGDNLSLKFDTVMRSVLNNGYDFGGTVTRTIKGEPKSFSVFAPLAIAAIGSLPLPLAAQLHYPDASLDARSENRRSTRAARRDCPVRCDAPHDHHLGAERAT
jgi:hypothetical protein